MLFLVAPTLLPAVYHPNDAARTTTAGTQHARANTALTNEDIGSVAKILGNRDHLVNNIANFEYSYLSS